MATAPTGADVVGDDGDLRRPCEGRRHADVAGDLLLGQRHVDVAGPGDDVDGADRLGAVGHGGDGLGSTDAVDLVDPGEVGGGQAGVGHRPVGPWRQAQHHLADPGHAGGDGVHEHGRRVGGEAPRHVHAGPVDGLGDGADPDAVALVAVLPGGLGPVEVLDGVVGGPEGGGHVLGQPVQCPGDLGRLTRGSARSTPSKRRVYSATAASPRCRTSATMAATAATGSSPVRTGRGSRARRSPARPRRSSTRREAVVTGLGGYPWASPGVPTFRP